MTMVGIGGARSDANEANDMQKLVFAYLSRRASHLCKPGMTMEEREDGEERARMTRKAFVMFA